MLFSPKESDAKLRTLGIEPKKVYDFFEDVKASESVVSSNYFAVAGIGESDANNVRAWLFARCLERRDPEGPIEKGLESIMEELPEGAVL